MAERELHTVHHWRDGQSWEEPRGYGEGPHTVRVKVVCKPCNNNWMSQLEDAAKPYIVELLTGHGTLDAEELEVLGRWAIKTAMMCEYWYPRGIVSTQAMRTAVMSGERPANAFVMLGTRGDGYAPIDVSVAPTRFDLPWAESDSDRLNWARVTIAIDRVVLLVSLTSDQRLGDYIAGLLTTMDRQPMVPLDDCAGRAWPLPVMPPEAYEAVKH